MSFDPARPYDDLPPLPPPVDVETAPVLKQCLKATRALAELKGAGGLIPDQAILINAIPLQEAQASSEIENILTTQDSLFRAAIDENRPADPQTKEVLRYRTALRRGYESLKEQAFSIALLREICSTLCDASVDFRQKGEDVYIGNPHTGVRRYTPPQGGPIIEKKLINLESYLLTEDGPDPLIRMAIAHYQFEAIHPFVDGNGRTGRILNILYLIHSGLLEIPVLYLSRYLIQHKAQYYRLLQQVSVEQNWEAWIGFMLQGVEETARWTTEMIRSIRALLEETIRRAHRDAPAVSHTKEVIELLFRQPYCKIATIVEAGLAKRQTAAVYLQALEKAGILTSETVGRERLFLNPRLLELLKTGKLA